MAAQRPRVEVLTPRGAGGVAVLSLRGRDRLASVSGWLRTRQGGPLDLSSCSVPRLALLCPGGEALDEVLVVDRPGLELLELHLHGSELVLDALAAHADLSTAAVSPAEDLLRVATSDAQLALALEQCEEQGAGFSARLRSLESLEPEVRASALQKIERRTEVARALEEPARVVLCGNQNAGKSTLMNRLLFRERVLTGGLPGLTRDPVREATTLCGYPYELVDTAGEGGAEHELDSAALLLGRRERQLGLCLLVVDGSRDASASDLSLHGCESLLVRTKTDLPQAEWSSDLGPSVRVSCLDAAQSGAVRTLVGEALRVMRGLPLAGPVGGLCALGSRQRAELAAAREGLVG